MSDQTGQAPAQLSQFTSLRFFAALAVLSSHLWVLQETPSPIQPLASTIFHEGYAGVSFFFMLSGFILSHTYQQKLLTRSISRTKYLLLRVARIYPLHLLTALPFAVWLLVAQGAGALPKIILNLSLLQSWVPDKAYYFTLNDPSWSLSDELFFYVAFAGLALVAPRRLARWAMALFAVAAILVVGLMVGGYPSWSINGELGLTHWLTYINPAVRLLDFVVGMLIYRCPKPRLGKGLSTAAEVASTLALIGAMYGFSALDLPEVARAQLLYMPFMAALIYAYSIGGGLVSRGLSNPSLVLLGESSFALYMIHLPILNGGYALFQRLGEPVPLLVYAAGMAVLCVALSILTFKVIERPLQNDLKRRIGLRLPR